jgi:alanine adding enzyme
LIFSEITDQEFSEFVLLSNQANFNQTLVMNQVRKDLGFETHLLGVRKNNTVVAAALVVIIKSRIKSAGIYYGPILNYADFACLEFFTQELKKYLFAKGVVYCKINPNFVYAYHNSDGQIDNEKYIARTEFANLINLGYIHNGWTKTGVDASNRWHYVKNLSQYFDSYENLIMSFRSTVRQRIKKYQKNNLEIRELSLDEIDIFLNLLDSSASKHGFTPRDKNYFLSLIEHFQKAGYLKLLCAWSGNTPISAALFIIYADECVYFHSGNNAEYIKFLGSYALQDYMFKYCLDKKISKYNFLGFEAVFDKPNGVLDFKRGFRGFIEELPGSFDLPIKTLKYKLYRFLKK